MARSFRAQRTYPAPLMYFVEKTRNIGSAGYNFKVTSENPCDGGVWFRIIHGMSAMSYGEKITVTITANGSQTNVDVFSECGMPTQLVDGGKNASNVNLIFRYFESTMPAAQNAAAQPASAQPVTPQPVAPQPVAPQPVRNTAPAVSARPKFCTRCGNRIGETDKFCTICGNRI